MSERAAAQVVLLVADGARTDTLATAMDAGALPALARLRDEGGLHTITSVFPSVTGPAYVPFLCGRYPGPAGIPGIRWLDRDAPAARPAGRARSYVGIGMRHIDAHLDPGAPTLFELAPPSLAAMAMFGRGLAPHDRLGAGAWFALRAARAHFRGDTAAWIRIDRSIAARLTDRLRRERPRFVFAAFTGADKCSHAFGHDSPTVIDALRVVDETAGRIRADAERDGRWERMRLWVTSDHGHSSVVAHDDLAALLRSWGLSTMAHPFTLAGGRDAAVMVSGNAMAHIYLEPDRRERCWWPELRARWAPLVESLVARPSVELLVVASGPTRCTVFAGGGGRASIERDAEGRFSYRPQVGDPLGVGAHERLSSADALDACAHARHPDAIVQLSSLAGATRSADVLLSAASGCDFREGHEPIPHRSSHGALHRDHMLVPLLLDRPPSRLPRRTVDVMPSVLSALGIASAASLDGEPFV